MAGNNTLALAEREPVRRLPRRRLLLPLLLLLLRPPMPLSQENRSPTIPQPSSGGPTSPNITWATPDPEGDAALKLLSQQGQQIFTGVTTSDMKDFLGQVGTRCLRGAMMVEFFHNTIDEVAVLPKIKKDFEAVTKKLKDDEVKMTEALGKVKNLTDDNLRLEEKNTKLSEEITQLKTASVAKKSEAIQAILEKQKMVEEVEVAKEEWKLKAAEYEKEILRVEDL
ncbi:hypothetical protein SESBI_50020 [Sesbania bispinosa]|nr:hypothetical protein SESBI_50020 [Sesbania bispinosa]